MTRSTAAVRASLLLFILAVPCLSAATRTWTGGAVISGQQRWTSPGNWGGVAPVAGDDLVFPAISGENITTNDYPAGTAFDSLTFSAPTTIEGSQIRLGAGGLRSSVAVGRKAA